jgi:ATP-dependent DNA helicase RecQ
VETSKTILKNTFGYDTFRPFQQEVIENVLARRDTLAIMPTGGGKSL